MPISAPKLVVEGLSAGYGAVRVLDEVSLTLAPGETVALLGTSGNGKSTLINSIMGLVRPSGGAVYLDGGGARTALT
ncbi:MAG: ATP-binding cassette domain-containing protein, partial [Stellaceae bacterium]